MKEPELHFIPNIATGALRYEVHRFSGEEFSCTFLGMLFETRFEWFFYTGYANLPISFNDMKQITEKLSSLTKEKLNGG